MHKDPQSRPRTRPAVKGLREAILKCTSGDGICKAPEMTTYLTTAALFHTPSNQKKRSSEIDRRAVAGSSHELWKLVR
jgi:hypothetical protein